MNKKPTSRSPNTAWLTGWNDGLDALEAEQAQAVEAVAVVLNGHYQQRAHLDDGIVHNLYLHPAPPATVGPVVTGATDGLSQDYNKGLGRWFADRPGARQQLRDDFPPPVATGERAELIERLRSTAFQDDEVRAHAREAADMLEADAALADDLTIAYMAGVDAGRKKAQQVAAPVPMSGYEISKWWASENGLEDCDMSIHGDFEKVVRAVEAHHGIGAKQ